MAIVFPESERRDRRNATGKETVREDEVFFSVDFFSFKFSIFSHQFGYIGEFSVELHAKTSFFDHGILTYNGPIQAFCPALSISNTVNLFIAFLKTTLKLFLI